MVIVELVSSASRPPYSLYLSSSVAFFEFLPRFQKKIGNRIFLVDLVQAESLNNSSASGTLQVAHLIASDRRNEDFADGKRLIEYSSTTPLSLTPFTRPGISLPGSPTVFQITHAAGKTGQEERHGRARPFDGTRKKITFVTGVWPRNPLVRSYLEKLIFRRDIPHLALHTIGASIVTRGGHRVTRAYSKRSSRATPPSIIADFVTGPRGPAIPAVCW